MAHLPRLPALHCCDWTFGWDAELIEKLALNAVRAALLPADEKDRLLADFTTRFAALRSVHLS